MNRPIATLLLSLSLACSSEKTLPVETVKAPESLTVSSVTPDPVSETLGNIRFQLKDPEKATSEEKAAFFEHLRAAYKKVSDFLGSEVMTSAEPRTFMVSIGKGNPRGLTRWSASMSGFDENVVPKNVSVKSTELFFGNTDEDNIAHELVHVFAQAPLVLSRVFYEGSAHAIDRHLYPHSNSQGDALRAILAQPKARPILDKGWDFTPLDVSSKGGIQDGDLGNFVTLEWEKEWSEFEMANPGFLRAFYQEVAARRGTEGSVLSREELIAIGQKVNPKFSTWFAAQKSFRPLGTGSKGTEAFVGALAKGNTDGIAFNFKLNPGKLGGTEGNKAYTPPSVHTAGISEWGVCLVKGKKERSCTPFKPAENAVVLHNPTKYPLSFVVDGKEKEVFNP